MSSMTIGIIIVVAIVAILGFKKLIAAEDHKNDRPDTIRDNNTDAGIQEVRQNRDLGDS